MNAGKKITNNKDHHSETLETVLPIADRAQIPSSSFDGSNFRDWKAKAEQFFELEGTPEEQRSRLLLLSMGGKAFAWQRHYMQNNNNKGNSWQQIIHDAGSRFDTGAFDDPIAEIA